HGHGLRLWLWRHRQDHRAGRSRPDRRLEQLPQAGRAADPDPDRLRLSRLLVPDGRRSLLRPWHGDPRQVDRTDRPGTECARRCCAPRDGSANLEGGMSTTSAELAGDRDVIARAEAIRGTVAAASDTIEATRRLPPDLLDRLHEARLFRLLLPRSSDGIET